MWNLKRNDTNELTYKTETDSETSRRSLWLLGGRMGERDNYGVWDGLLYLKWITNKDLLYSTWNSVQRYEAAWMKGEFGVHVFVWLSPLPFT